MQLASVLKQLKGYKKAILNSFWIAFDKVVRMAGGLVVGIWFAKYLGPYEFGAWNYAYSLVALAIPFINLGLNNVLLTDLIREPDKGKIVFSGLLLKLCSGSLFTLLIYLLSFTLQSEPTTRSLLIILSFQCIFQAFDVFDTFYQSRTESQNSVMAKTCAYVAINAAKILALIKGYSVLFFGALTVLEVAVSSFVLLVFYFKKSKQTAEEWRINVPTIKNLLWRSSPFIVAELMITAYMRLDQVMIKNMIGNEALGKYSAAVRLSEIWYVIGSAITVSLYPAIIRLKQKDEQAYRNGFQRLFNILTTISVLIAVVVTLFSNYIIHVLYGPAYEGVGLILAIHIWTGVFVYLGIGGGNWLMVENLQRYVVVRTVLGAAINAVLNLVLIPTLQGAGAALATLIGQVFASVLANAFSSKTRTVFFLQLRSFLVFLRPGVKNYFS